MTRAVTFTEREWHRKSAIDLFNSVWALLEKKRRTREEEDRMVHATHASRYHWGEVGTALNLAIGEWQISRVYSVLRRPEPARFHGARCLEICEEHGLKDFVLAYAHEALARAAAVAGKKRGLRRHLASAREAGRGIGEAEDRERLFRDLRTIRVAKP